MAAGWVVSLSWITLSMISITSAATLLSVGESKITIVLKIQSSENKEVCKKMERQFIVLLWTKKNSKNSLGQSVVVVQQQCHRNGCVLCSCNTGDIMSVVCWTDSQKQNSDRVPLWCQYKCYWYKSKVQCLLSLQLSTRPWRTGPGPDCQKLASNTSRAIFGRQTQQSGKNNGCISTKYTHKMLTTSSGLVYNHL